MKPDEFLEVAAFLPRATNCSTPEARVRTTVGRAYYAIYLDSVALLDALDLHPGSQHGNAPTKLYQAAKHHADDTFELVAVALQSLYEARQQADYRFPSSPNYDFESIEYAEKQVSVCQSALGRVRELRRKYVPKPQLPITGGTTQ